MNLPDVLHLLPNHLEMLEQESGISAEVIEGRGYRSIHGKGARAELHRFGYSGAAQLCPTLFIPIYNVEGEQARHHHRPDTPHGQSIVVDVHPFLKDKVRDPRIPLFITEGIKKADAAISRGLCCIAVAGVWNFRGTNEHGGLTTLPDWQGIALKGKDEQCNKFARTVYVCYDSDAIIKASVYASLKALAGVLKNKGASIRYIYLPTATDGNKTGLDDFFAARHTVDDLMQNATETLREPPVTESAYPPREHPYIETDHGLTIVKRGRDTEFEVDLANFTARIVEDVQEDDGVETRRFFHVEAKVSGRSKCFDVPVDQFPTMNWVTNHLGARAIVYPGQNNREHIRAAIQLLSQPTERHIRAHMGWIKHNGHWCYAHAGGIIGQTSDTPDPIEVRLTDPLSRFSLPDPSALPTNEVKKSTEALLDVLNVGRPEVVVPVFCTALRATLMSSDFSVFLAGPTGVFKSELAALVQQFYGAGMTGRNLPADWSATDNYLEGLAFGAKDALLVIDEFVPKGASHDRERQHAKADRVLRAQGNNAARGRMRADGSLRAAKPPRGTILATGEDIPQGQSLRARMLVVEVGKGDIKTDYLSKCQQEARSGTYATAMAAFIAWLASDYDELQVMVPREVALMRDKIARTMAHRRTPEIVANLAVGLLLFLKFAEEQEIFTSEEVKQEFDKQVGVLKKVAQAQAQHQEANEPTQRYLELISAALAAGHVHLASLEGDIPKHPVACGWYSVNFSAGGNMRNDWQSQGRCIGFVEGDNLYLMPDVAYQVAQRLASESGDGVAVKPTTLNKRLHEKGYLVTTDEKRGRLTIRVTARGIRQTVLHLRTTDVLPPAQETSQPAHSPTSSRDGNEVT